LWKAFLFSTRRQTPKRKRQTKEKKRQSCNQIVPSFLSPRTRCPAGYKIQPATLFTDQTLSFPPCFAQGKRTGALQKRKERRKKAKKRRILFSLSSSNNSPFVQTFLQVQKNIAVFPYFEVQKRALSKESTRASSRIIQTAMTFKEDLYDHDSPKRGEGTSARQKANLITFFVESLFLFSTRRQTPKRKRQTKEKRKEQSCNQIVPSFLSPRTRCPAGYKVQTATLFTDQTLSFPPCFAQGKRTGALQKRKERRKKAKKKTDLIFTFIFQQ
jgi:hypothetical protein